MCEWKIIVLAIKKKKKTRKILIYVCLWNLKIYIIWNNFLSVVSFDFTIFNNSNKRFLKVCFPTVQLSNEESFDDIIKFLNFYGVCYQTSVEFIIFCEIYIRVNFEPNKINLYYASQVCVHIFDERENINQPPVVNWLKLILSIFY